MLLLPAVCATSKVTWKLVDVYRKTSTCENCGHGIATVCVVRASNGTTREVGTDCVWSLVDRTEAATADKIIGRYSRAKSQWRAKKPAPRDGETRDQYIDRRVVEMGNALRAANAAFATSWWSRAVALAKRENITMDEANERMYCEIETKYSANRFDFNRPAYQVRKV